jgi:hypothetical protein
MVATAKVAEAFTATVAVADIFIKALYIVKMLLPIL